MSLRIRGGSSKPAASGKVTNHASHPPQFKVYTSQDQPRSKDMAGLTSVWWTDWCLIDNSLPSYTLHKYSSFST